MQSHLQAALLGHGGNANVTATTEDDEQEEEGEDVDFIDEECDGDGGAQTGKVSTGNSATGRTITLQMLLSAGILQPGNGTMTIEYLGQKFVGDLLEDGKIRSQETDIIFASPSAWAIASKRFINPDKKSGCGWASVKYKGKKLDAYKNIWYKKKKEDEQRQDKEYTISEGEIESEGVEPIKTMISIPQSRVVVKHNTIANRTFMHDANTLIECIPFSNLSKIQPFLVSLSTNAALLMDFHCHLTNSEVSGYLAGYWDVNIHNLQITRAYPCRNTKADREKAPQVELQIQKLIEKERLTLVGWYHSHPFCTAAPTLRDIDAQLDYQIRMKGTCDNSYTPCVGIIVSPYNYENTSLESNIIAYWVIPPPEAKPNEYGRPMLMSYSVVQDAVLPSNIMDEIKKCVEYYKKEKDFVNFSERYSTHATFIEKLKTTLTSKFPRDQSESTIWTFIREQLGCTVNDKGSPISIPSISKSSQMLSSLGPSLMLNSDLASVLFSSGKFPNPSSLLGIPDPMAQSTLAVNNMFLSPSLFKMQDLLKPLSTSSPIPSSKSKYETKSTHLKIPGSSEIKTPSMDYMADLTALSLKNNMEFSSPELNLTKARKSDFSASDLSISSVKSSKIDFSACDLSISSVRPPKTEYTLNFSKNLGDLGDVPQKIPKTDFSLLDLNASSSKSLADTLSNIPSDLSVTKTDIYPMGSSGMESDYPLNLTPE